MVAANHLVGKSAWSVTCHLQGKNMACIFKPTNLDISVCYKFEENTLSQSCQEIKVDQIGSSSLM